MDNSHLGQHVAIFHNLGTKIRIFWAIITFFILLFSVFQGFLVRAHFCICTLVCFWFISENQDNAGFCWSCCIEPSMTSLRSLKYKIHEDSLFLFSFQIMPSSLVVFYVFSIILMHRYSNKGDH